MENGFIPLIPVRTDKPILKDKLNEVLMIIAQTVVNAPIKMGDILINDVLNSGANIIASRDLSKS